MRAISKIISSNPMADLLFRGGAHVVALRVERKAGVRRMRLSVDPRTSAVRLVLPPRGALAPALVWAETKRDWVEQQLALLPAPVAILPGMTFSVAGELLRIDWSLAHPRNPARIGDQLRVGGPLDLLDARVLRWLRREALTRLRDETNIYAARAGVSVTKIGVGDTVSRWGSCAANGTIRYSWRLILAPLFVLRATVAHEVAHRRHMNHSADFYAALGEVLGADPAPARAWLRTYGATLHGFGRTRDSG